MTELRGHAAPARLLLPPRNEADRLVARVAQVPQPAAGQAVVLAQSGDGRTPGPRDGGSSRRREPRPARRSCCRPNCATG